MYKMLKNGLPPNRGASARRQKVHHGTSRYDIDIDMMYFKICDFKDFQKLL
jgi:hypothetical protein